jgi:hypothetical protein
MMDRKADLLVQILVDDLGHVRELRQDFLHLIVAFILVIVPLPSNQHTFEFAEGWGRLLTQTLEQLLGVFGCQCLGAFGRSIG